MESDRDRVKEILFAVSDLGEAERAAFLDEACKDDPELRRQVKSILAQDEHSTRLPKFEERLKIPPTDTSHAGEMIGRTVSHYEIQQLLGEGGMGVVYKAWDTRLQRPVALKFLRSRILGSGEMRTRFVREAQNAAALDHPNICTIHAIEEANGRTFLSMAFVEGETLKAQIANAPLDLSMTLDLVLQIAAGLKSAHERGIIHRDIKSANIMVTEEGQAKILDFGLARSITQTEITKPGSTMGTVSYMSPEQAHGGSVDHRTDIWSLGVVCYEMLTGRLPFTGVHEQAVIYAIMSTLPTPVTRVRPDLPTDFDWVLAKTLAREPCARYQNVADLMTDLQALKRGFQPKVAEAAAPVERVPSIAVLSLADLSAGHDQEYFCDGIAEEVINSLSHLTGLRVVSRTSSFQFKGRGIDIREIGRQLQVETVLEGSVRKAGDRLRITAQLINVADGYHLWSERYDREMADIFEIQDEIAFVIVDKLKVKLLGGEKDHLAKRNTNDPQAFNLYLKGRYHLNKRTNADLRRSIDHFEHALALDSSFALANAGMADAYVALGWHDYMPGAVAFKKATQEATKALRIDEKIGEAYSSRALVKELYEWDWVGARADFEQAISLNPSDAEARHQYAHLLAVLGDFDGAVREMKRALDLEPLSLVISSCYGQKLYYAREFDAAIEQHQRTIELDPNYYVPHLHIGYDYEQKQMFDEAAAEFEKAIGLSEGILRAKGALARIYAIGGRETEARELLAELLEQWEPGDVATYVALVFFGLGEKDQGFEWLNKAYDHRHSYLIYLRDPLWDDLRSDVRFRGMCEKMGLGDCSVSH